MSHSVNFPGPLDDPERPHFDLPTVGFFSNLVRTAVNRASHVNEANLDILVRLLRLARVLPTGAICDLNRELTQQGGQKLGAERSAAEVST